MNKLINRQSDFSLNKPKCLLPFILCQPIRKEVATHLDADLLLSKKLDRAKAVQGATSGVYYLFGENGDLLYVGKASYVQGRICAHKGANRIPFVYATILPVESANYRTLYEKQAIIFFRPLFNRQYNPDYRKRKSISINS